MAGRRDVLRLAGAATTGGLAAALAGCSERVTSEAPEERWSTWAYDPETYGEDWQEYQLQYFEPTTMSRNRMYFTEDQRSQHFFSVPWADFGDLDYYLELAAGGGNDSYPTVTVVEGSFGVDDVRRNLAEQLTREGTVAGRELYGSQREYRYAIDQGELVVMANSTRSELEAYLRDSDRSFVGDTPAFGQFFDRVGVGASTRMRLSGDGIEGFSYNIDGPTTTVKAMVPGSPALAERRQFERRVSEVGARLGYPDAATVEFEDRSLFLELRMETREAPFGRSPFSVLAER